ncbi:sensor histidine kinase [Fusibacter ferrireducens]|uniref:histidine kinase n=1 Tax=Fusibacter ferrireducens TaxID=2785058 RepID=A0ABR9ZZQ9_9FIRM|nr:PocR ligand-binding domain-containing protein [Fusibacter ferrireducens]MBF4695937.1 PocR ligand-binding domain-containing protein [Fusibacter ferrireducens]
MALLQDIQDNFSDVTKMAVITVDFKGEPITQHSNFTKFCQKFRENDQCKRICYKSDAHGGVEAARSQKPFIYKCHTGLVDFAVPLLFEGQYLGSILGGQVKVKDGEYANAIPYDQSIVDERLTDTELRQFYDEIEAVTVQEVESAAKLMYIMANYIVEQAFNQRIQEELNEKNNKLIGEMAMRVTLEKNLRESELQLLQSQVNPHFLFNVLNTINSLAMIEKAKNTSDMIYSLSDMLRYTIQNKMHYMVTLAEEIDYNDKYLQIQNVRLGNKIDIQIRIDAALNDLKVPFMIIQPLVANAIDHGLFEMDACGKLNVYSKEDQQNAYIIVEDNGRGIPKETIKAIQEGNYKSKTNKSTGTGLITLEKRLIHRFGEQYRLQIESRLNMGTKITVKIPKEQSYA